MLHDLHVNLTGSRLSACQTNIVGLFLFILELLRVKTEVMTAQLEQFGVRSFLCNMPVLDDHDAISAADGAQAVGNYERGATLHESFHASLDECLGQSVHARGGFIHDEDLGFGQNGARQADELLLTD